MNSSYDDLAALITTGPAGWDKSPIDAVAAMAAYYESEEQQRMTNKPPPIPAADPNIFAGVNACMLAQLALQITFTNPKSVRAQMTVAAANNVLRCWNLQLEDHEFEQTEEGEPPDVAKEELLLVWPPVDREGRPLTTKLADVYRENFYRVHEQMMVTHTMDTIDFLIEPHMNLVLHEAYWNEESLQWRMHFSYPSHTGIEGFWLDHCKVKPGGEIIPNLEPTP